MSQNTGNIRLIIFDWAGTTVDFGSRAPAAAFAKVFAANQVDVSDAEARKPMGLSKREHLVANCDYVGQGYGLPTEGMVEAVKLVARTEGILLDPVYSGKAMAGLIDLVQKGHFAKDETIVFLHTGGAVGLFGYPNAFGLPGYVI